MPQIISPNDPYYYPKEVFQELNVKHLLMTETMGLSAVIRCYRPAENEIILICTLMLIRP